MHLRSEAATEAFRKLYDDPRWTTIRAEMLATRDDIVSALVQSGTMSEFDRGILAGKIQMLDELLALAQYAGRNS